MQIKVLGESNIPEVVNLGLKIFSPIAGEKDSKKTHNRKEYLRKLSENGLLLGAYVNNKIVGYALAYKKNEGILHLSLIGVLPKNRGVGIGIRLLKEVEKEAKYLRYKKISINSFTPIFNAMFKLLEKNNYKVVEKKVTIFGEEKIPAIKYGLIKNLHN